MAKFQLNNHWDGEQLSKYHYLKKIKYHWLAVQHTNNLGHLDQYCRIKSLTERLFYKVLIVMEDIVPFKLSTIDQCSLTANSQSFPSEMVLHSQLLFSDTMSHSTLIYMKKSNLEHSFKLFSFPFQVFQYCSAFLNMKKKNLFLKRQFQDSLWFLANWWGILGRFCNIFELF